MPRQQQKRPGDVTGRKAQALMVEHQEDLKAREGEIALIHQAEAAKKDEIVDLTAPPPKPVEESPVEVQSPTREFRVNADIEDMTFGAGNLYTFEEGVKYKAPKEIYDHLDALGYVWH